MNSFFFTALLLLMMEVLLLSARISTPVTASHRDRVKKRTQALCVGGKWFQVGSFRFWQRSTCGQRRQRALAPTEPPPKTTLDRKILRKGGWPTAKTKQPSTIDFDLILPSEEDGPKRNESYDPNYGFEPYWDQGGWVFDKRDHSKDKDTYMCGVKCPQIYSEYGKICARNKHQKYKTFENYCQLRNKDCSDLDRWMVLYGGKCYRDLHKYKRRFTKTAAKKALEKFIKLYPKHEEYAGLCKDCKI